MQFILTPDESRQADNIAIHDYLIDGSILMENAARSVADMISEILSETEIFDASILILCGSGNNGGDGFAVARHLSNEFEVRVAWIGSEEKMSSETRRNFQILQKMEIPLTFFENETDISNFDFQSDIIVDSLIGVGGSENLQGMVINILQIVNQIESYKIAIDVPTGLNSLTGFAHEDAFYADKTVTMFAVKTGMLLNDGLNICGDISVASLGAPETIVSRISKIGFLEDDDLITLLPERKRISSKFDYGKVLIVAGSVKMPGAAALTANAAIKAGAGLVYLMSSSIHPALFPEIIPTLLTKDNEGFIDNSSKFEILAMAEKANVLVFGPGMGNSSQTIKMISEILLEIPETLPVILDADSIQAVSHNMKLRKNILLTPHLGEFSKLTGIPREEISKATNSYANEWAEKLNCSILLKHVPSVISNGEFSFWNIGGNPGMATAGSGDVLTGIIAALVGQGLKTFEAGAIGAFLHSKAGDSYCEKFSEITLTASDIISELENVLNKL